MLKTILSVAAVLSLTATAANAAVIGYTEGVRDLVPGTTRISGPDASATPPGFDLTQDLPDGDLDSGDRVDLYGRIVGSTDAFRITANSGFTLDLLDIRPESGSTNHRLAFRLVRVGGGFDLTAFADTNTMAQTLITAVLGGTYDLIIDMQPDTGTALYDLSITALGDDIGEVPLPAAMPLFAAGLAGLTAVRRRRRKA